MSSANDKTKAMNIVLLCGGVGGSKMAEGLYHSAYNKELSIIGNVADDQEFHGLWVSPDIDTLTYTLADIIDSEKGWGLSNETDHTLNALNRLGCDTWMYLGDQDFATHIYRTQQRTLGVRPSEIASTIAKKLGVKANIVLPTDQVIQNRVRTDDGWQDFQSYFVKNGCQEQILEMNLSGIEQAHATPEVLTTIAEADFIIIAPSNPIVSISPILAIPGIEEALHQSSAPIIAVSPIINGKAIRGPADKMMNAAGYSSDVMGVAQCYQGVIDGIVIDKADQHFVPQLERKNLQVMVTDTLMNNRQSKVDLANAIVEHMTDLSTLAKVS